MVAKALKKVFKILSAVLFFTEQIIQLYWFEQLAILKSLNMHILGTIKHVFSKCIIFQIYNQEILS